MLIKLRLKEIIYQDICSDDIRIVAYGFYKKHLAKQQISRKSILIWVKS